jgi:hypothetical protein
VKPNLELGLAALRCSTACNSLLVAPGRLPLYVLHPGQQRKPLHNIYSRCALAGEFTIAKHRCANG